MFTQTADRWFQAKDLNRIEAVHVRKVRPEGLRLGPSPRSRVTSTCPLLHWMEGHVDVIPPFEVTSAPTCPRAS